MTGVVSVRPASRGVWTVSLKGNVPIVLVGLSEPTRCVDRSPGWLGKPLGILSRGCDDNLLSKVVVTVNTEDILSIVHRVITGREASDRKSVFRAVGRTVELR